MWVGRPGLKNRRALRLPTLPPKRGYVYGHEKAALQAAYSLGSELSNSTGNLCWHKQYAHQRIDCKKVKRPI